MSLMRTPLIILALSVLSACRLAAGVEDDWFDPAFVESNTLKGGTGFILVPSPEILGAGQYSASIHRYQLKLASGFGDALELGLTADLNEFRVWSDMGNNYLLFARLRLLSLERNGVGLSVGVDGVGFEDLGARGLGFTPKKGLENLERLYGVAGLPLPFYPSLMVTAGFGTGAMPAHWFFNLSKVLLPGWLAMAEYDGFGTNLGTRLLLSPRIKLDLDFTHTQEVDLNKPFANILDNNVHFGISYSEAWNISLAYLTAGGKKNAPKAKEQR